MRERKTGVGCDVACGCGRRVLGNEQGLEEVVPARAEADHRGEVNWCYVWAGVHLAMAIAFLTAAYALSEAFSFPSDRLPQPTYIALPNWAFGVLMFVWGWRER